MASWQGVGHMRLCSALRKANTIRKAGEAGSSSSSSSSQAGLISDNTEVVQLLVRASEQYSQVSKATLSALKPEPVTAQACFPLQSDSMCLSRRCFSQLARRVGGVEGEVHHNAVMSYVNLC